MARKKLENYLSPISRKKRSSGKDTARCYIVQSGVRREILLGPWGSPEAQKLYNRIAAEFYGSGTLSEDIKSRGAISMSYLFAQFLHSADLKVKDPNNKFDVRELQHYETVIRYVMDIYADLPVQDFNCSAYRNVRQYLVSVANRVEWRTNGVYKSGKNPDGTSRVGQPKRVMSKRKWTKNYVLQLMDYLRKILHWGVSHDLLELSMVERFKYVEPLSAPTLDVQEPRQEVPDSVIKATMPFMTPTLREMIIIQRGSGLRPSEVCNMRVGDINRTGSVWTIAKSGKTSWKTGIPLIICFSDSERNILEHRITGKRADDYVWTPAESDAERRAERATKRKTKVQPSQKARAEKKTEEEKRAKFSPCYTPNSYYRAINYAQKKAKKHGVDIPHWFPYQIRHTAVTEIAYEHDRQTAAFLAGHTCISTTNRYAHEMVKVKADLARERQAYWTEE